MRLRSWTLLKANWNENRLESKKESEDLIDELRKWKQQAPEVFKTENMDNQLQKKT